MKINGNEENPRPFPNLIRSLLQASSRNLRDLSIVDCFVSTVSFIPSTKAMNLRKLELRKIPDESDASLSHPEYLDALFDWCGDHLEILYLHSLAKRLPRALFRQNLSLKTIEIWSQIIIEDEDLIKMC